MPEGHTLRRLADDLDAAFTGHRVRVSSPQGRFAADAAVLDGETLVGADSAGKHLFVEFPGDRFIHIHLGLIGKFDLHPTPVPEPVGQVRLRLQDEATYADLRGAIQCDLIGRDRHDHVIAPARQLAVARAIPGATIHDIDAGHAACALETETFVPAFVEACATVNARRRDFRARESDSAG